MEWGTLVLLLIFNVFTLTGQLPQIAIPRIDLMPNEPSPYNVRDWKQVALRYDSFIYDLQKTGQYLPVVHVEPAGFNYPQNPVFGLHSYVGTNSPLGNESINALPSLVGASLNGVDKTNQFGRNWLLMSQDFFSKVNGEGIYLNSPGSSSGSDWWYDLMPNVYFYQLYNLYPNMGGAAGLQFTSVADRFLESVKGLGGNDKPWSKASMNYRAWNFKTKQPNPGGVVEPEAAGAYAWVLYHAYKQTGNPEYLKGAEWSLEFLNEWPTNPSYELQLPYGTYTAAKMNAELGTKYDVEKMVNWSFNRGPLRGWGTIVGTWGGFDVSGLVGEANDAGNDYGFQMNGIQQAGMLAPMVRYDKRFARAIGKWILNLANATRLLYPGFLPSNLQDASAWSGANDPDRVIGYEALRQKWQGLSPFSTGDAVQGGWAGTNLALYGTSSIGYLGAILEKTNVDKILKINLLKTDFYRQQAYPTYLMFNPYAVQKTVTMDVGSAPADVYDAVSETFLIQNATGTVNLNIPANQALLVAITPASGVVTYHLNQMLVNGVVVDFKQSTHPFSYPPRIQALASAQPQVVFGDSTAVYAKVSDQDSGNFTWSWSTSGGAVSGTGATVHWVAPQTAGDYTITLIVTDDTGNHDTATISVKAVAQINLPPHINGIQKSSGYVAPGGALDLTCQATDPNGDPLTYTWTAGAGSLTGSSGSVSWTAPTTDTIVAFHVTVSDNHGLTAEASTMVLVKNFDPTPADLIAYYPFTGNANDVSGHQLNGQATGGATYTTDFWGNPTQACLLDGNNDYVNVVNDPLLNFQDAITVSCWFRPKTLPDHESFLVSHGSWQNRWKISVTPDEKIRWTVNTVQAVADLDGLNLVSKDSIYQVTVTYDGKIMALYLNGQLNSYKTLTGKIRTTSYPLLIGQMLPGNQAYNFNGTIDEVKIYDRALTPAAVLALYANSPTATADLNGRQPSLILMPNPVGSSLTVQLPEGENRGGQISIYDLTGRLIASKSETGYATIQFETSGWQPGVYMLVYKTNTRCISAGFMKT
jgi:hypothetical protein